MRQNGFRAGIVRSLLGRGRKNRFRNRQLSVGYYFGNALRLADFSPCRQEPSGARPADVFNAATIGGADALGRKDLGRLAAGAKADVVILNIRTTRYGPARDPINALVEYGSGADVETVIVDGEVVIENGCSTRIDDADLFAQAEAGAKHAWDNWAARDWNGRRVEDIVPPAFPPRNA